MGLWRGHCAYAVLYIIARVLRVLEISSPGRFGVEFEDTRWYFPVSGGACSSSARVLHTPFLGIKLVWTMGK